MEHSFEELLQHIRKKYPRKCIINAVDFGNSYLFNINAYEDYQKGDMTVFTVRINKKTMAIHPFSLLEYYADASESQIDNYEKACKNAIFIDVTEKQLEG